MTGLSLVTTPEATGFFQQSKVMRKLMLGDPAKLDSSVYNAVNVAHEALGEGMSKVSSLTNDKTRTDVQRHAAAKTIAERTVAVLEDTKLKLETNAKRLDREAASMVTEQFSADPDRAVIQSEIRGWIREQAKAKDGLKKIREAMEAEPEVGSVLYHSPHFLLNLAPGVRQSLVLQAIETHVPKASALLDASIALEKAASKYPKAIATVRRTFFNAALAVQANTRVEV